MNIEWCDSGSAGARAEAGHPQGWPCSVGRALGEQHLDWTGRAGKGLMGLQDFNLNYMGNRECP